VLKSGEITRNQRILKLAFMQNNFFPLSEIQKMLVFSPIKTYRLFVKLKQEGRFREEQDWIIRDQKLFIDLPRFFTELETDGYKNIVQDDFIGVLPQSSEISRHHMNSDDIERNQTEITPQEKREETIHAADPSLKSDDIIRNHLNTNEDDLKSGDINSATLMSAEIVRAKTEIIDVLKESLQQANEQLMRAERDKEHYRKEMEYISQQNQRLTQLTYMLSAPKREPAVREAMHDRTQVYTESVGEQQKEEEMGQEPAARDAAVQEEETPPEHDRVETGPVGEPQEEEVLQEPAVRDGEAQEEEMPAEPIFEEQPAHVDVTSEEGRGETKLPQPAQFL
jgi:hypothetical protein